MTAALSPRDWSSHPGYLDEGYRSTALRGPTKPLIPVKSALSILSAPVFGHDRLGELDGDLTRNGIKDGEPLGERIIVTGRVLDEAGRACAAHADRDLAGEHSRALHPQGGSARGPA